MRLNKKIESGCTSFFLSKKTVKIKWYLLESPAFLNLLKNRKILPAERFGNILAFNKEFKRKSNHLYQQAFFLKTICI